MPTRRCAALLGAVVWASLSAGCGLPRVFGVRDDGAGHDAASVDVFGTDASDVFDGGVITGDAPSLPDGTDVPSVPDVFPGGDSGIPPLTDPQCPGGTTLAVSHVSVGDLTACAVRCDGKVFCWGAGMHGQLGRVLTNGEISSATPLEVPGMWAYDVAAGRDHVCAIDSLRQVVCWGRNDRRQLGLVSDSDPDLDVSFRPVPGVTNALTIAAGDGTTCVWTVADELWCWGENGSGQAGDPSGTTPLGPTRLALPMTPNAITATVHSVSLGNVHGCAVRADSQGNAQTFCWGTAANGRLGTGDTNGTFGPTNVMSASGFEAVMAGDAFTLALPLGSATSGGGTPSCWGYEDTARCGNGLSTGADLTTPTVMPWTTGATTLARSSGFGVRHGCALTGDTIYCWGADDLGQARGSGMDGAIYVPTAWGFSPGVSEVAVGRQNSALVDADGYVYAWGGGGYGALGPNGTADTTVDDAGVSKSFLASEVRVPIPRTP